MVFKTTLIILHSYQIFFSAICVAASTAIQIKITVDGAALNQSVYEAKLGVDRATAFYTVYGVAFTSLLAAAVLLLCRYFIRQQSRAIHIAILSVSVVWTILWVAALVRFAIVGNLKDTQWIFYTNSSYLSYYSYYGYYDYYFVFTEEEKVYIVSTVEWAVGILLVLLWLATAVLACLGIVLHTRAARAGRTIQEQPQTYKGFEDPRNPGHGPQQASPQEFMTLDRVL